MEVYDEIERLLTAELMLEPNRHLRRHGGLQYPCRVVEQGSPPTVHIFLFRLRISQDEQTLIVWDCHPFPLRG